MPRTAAPRARDPRDQRTPSDRLRPPPGTSLSRFLKSICLPKVNDLAHRYAEHNGRPKGRMVSENLDFVRNRLLPYLEFDVARDMTPKLARYGVEEMLEAMRDRRNRLPRDVAEYAGRLYQKFDADGWDATRPKPRAPPISTDELPPEDHDVWGVGGIMHGVAMTKEPGRKLEYRFDPRYGGERRGGESFGHNGLAVGDWFPKLIVANFRGAHSQLQRGISGDADAGGAYSVLVSGEYSGLDMDEGEVVYYSAEGARGRDARDRFDAKANMAMTASVRTRNPVRVLRSSKGARSRTYAPACGIRYDGLYRVTEVRFLVNDEGGSYQRFRLERLGGQPSLDSVLSVPNEEQKRQFDRIKDGY